MTQTLKKVGNYKFIRKIGAGATSEVFEGRKEGELERYAIKMIKIKSMSKEQRDMIAKQVLIIKNINHPHIVKLSETLETTNHYYLIFEFCQKGDLQKYLKENVGTLLTLDNVRKIITCIAQAVQHLHAKGIAHRDIKLANILLKKDFTIKLADFGFARESNSEEVMMRTYCGTPITMAPQILKGKPYDKKCDIWSLGVILFQLTFGKLPFPIDQGYAVFADKVANEKVKIPNHPEIPQSLKDLIFNCLQANQVKRYSIEEMLDSVWMKQQSKLQDIKEENMENINQVLKKAAKENKMSEFSQEQFQNNKSVSIFQRLLACRLCGILNSQINKILTRHIQIRKQILKLNQDNKELHACLIYYDRQILWKWRHKSIKIRFEGQPDVYVPIQSLKLVQFPQYLGDKSEPVQISSVLMGYLRQLSTINIDLEKKKCRYSQVMNFLDFVQNFELEITLFFNNCYEMQFSLPRLAQYIIDTDISEDEAEDYHKGLNHITIALECRQKDDRFREAANGLKMNCQKRIDDIQREINGY